MSETDRIRWQCRRGLLELDLVLATFCDRHLERLETKELELFRELLASPDNDLLDLVMGREPSADPRFNALLERLRGNSAAAVSSRNRCSENRRLL
jgi:antitoxin CptB